MYVDDITLFCLSKTLDSMESKPQNAQQKLKMHKLVVYSSRSSTLLFGSRQRIHQSTINIAINGTPAIASETFKGTHTVYFSSSLYIINQKPIIPRTDFHCITTWVASG